MTIKVNGDYHEFEFSGPAQDLIDSSSFTSGLGALSAFPVEPAMEQLNAQAVPGHLGQAWLGAIVLGSLRHGCPIPSGKRRDVPVSAIEISGAAL